LPTSHDAFALDGQTAAFYVADVSDHGPGPALITMLLRQLLFDLREGGHRDILRSPGLTLAAIYQRLSTEALCEHFITLLYGVIHGPDQSLVYASAGHPLPLLFLGGELVEPEDVNGAILSPWVEPGDGWPERTIHLPPGSRVAVYTDGLTEEPLRLWLREGRHLRGEDWACRAIEVARRHVGAAGPVDDMTLLVISAEG
jgi:serine phosphatase RsbU (regulator of sigma subunit)